MPVTDIINVPLTAAVGVKLTLAGTVVPPDATYKALRFAVQRSTSTAGIHFTQLGLIPTGTGTIVVTASTYGDGGVSGGPVFEKEFTIIVSPGSETWAPVADANEIEGTWVAALDEQYGYYLGENLTPITQTIRGTETMTYTAGGSEVSLSADVRVTYSGSEVSEIWEAVKAELPAEATYDDATYTITTTGAQTVPVDELLQANPMISNTGTKLLLPGDPGLYEKQ